MGPKVSTPEDNKSVIKINHTIFALARLIKYKDDEELIQT